MGVASNKGDVKHYSSFSVHGTIYQLRDCVYLPSDYYHFPVKPAKRETTIVMKHRDKDESKYPELYRKSEYVKGSNMDVPEPFQIGQFCV